MGRYVGSLGEEQASFTMPVQFLGVGDCGWPVKTCSEGLPDQCPGGAVVTRRSNMYVF